MPEPHHVLCLHNFESFYNLYKQEKQDQQVTPQVTQQVKQLLVVLEGDLGRSKLMNILGLKDRINFARNYLDPAKAAGLIEMVQPGAPNSPTQKYRLTAQGRALVHD